MRKRISLAFVVLCCGVCGCAHFDALKTRHEQTDAFITHLASLTEAELSQPLSLDGCIRIAMRNNYEGRRVELTRQLYQIGKDLAFTAFLPDISTTAGYTHYAKQPMMMSTDFATANLDIHMPVFMPCTWFLYMAAQHGYASAEMAANYAKQAIVLQTTANYFNLLVQQDTVAALESQLAAAREIASRAQGFAEEGLVARWEGDQAVHLAESREVQLNRSHRQVEVLRSKLLEGMGLSPLAPVSLSGEAPEPRRLEGDVEDLVLQALETHPHLSIADRMVVVEENQVRKAFTDFLPNLSLFSSGTWTSDDLAIHTANWISGLQGAWAIFDSFTNLVRYRAAKLGRRQAELARESTFLSIMVQVVAAKATAQDAGEAAQLRQRTYEVAAAKFEDYDAKAQEGLLPLTEALDARAAMDMAQVELVQSRYMERVALANLELAMGITLIPEEFAESNEGN